MPHGYFRAPELPRTFTIHSFRLGDSLESGKSLTGTAVDEIMKVGGWKTKTIAKYYTGATSRVKVHGSERKQGQIINTSYQKSPFCSGDDPDKLFFHQPLN